jgi:hypothetical protein
MQWVGGTLLQDAHCLVAENGVVMKCLNIKKNERKQKRRNEHNKNKLKENEKKPATACFAASSRSFARNSFRPLSDGLIL